MGHWGVSPCCTNPPVANAEHRDDTNPPRTATEAHPHPQTSPVLWGDHCGPDDRDCHTHNLAEPLCQEGRDTIDTCCAPGPDIATVGHARRRSTPTPRGNAQTTHRARAIVLCALRRPTCPLSKAIGRTQAGCSHSSANTLGPVHHMARTHQTDDKCNGRKKKGVHQQRVLC